MNTLSATHYKDRSPKDTVDKLINTLNSLGLEVEEDWMDASYVNTYSLRLTFKGTKLGTNGKGVTKDYARASAYAELFERYQNNLLAVRWSRLKKPFGFYDDKDEKLMTAEEIIEQGGAFLNEYFNMLGMKDASANDKTQKLLSIEKSDSVELGLNNLFVCLPFYSVRENKIYYLPTAVYTKLYGSNGMCAGNTPEEAIVQGIAEIFERVVQRRLFMESPCLPDIPDDYIAKFPYIDVMYRKLKAKPDYNVSLKDCSFGGKYPVAALFISEKNSGYYGIKLGCHPDYGIAMERTFTEAAQGNEIFDFSKRSRIDYYNKGIKNDTNIANSFKMGAGQYPYQLFGSKPTYAFTPVKDVSSMSNREILHYWIHEILEDGNDVLIRDVSSLDFPSYHLIIPGESEMYPISKDFNETIEKRIRAHNTRFYTSKLLIEHQDINRDNVKYIISSLQFYNNGAMENTMESYVRFSQGWPYAEIYCDLTFFLAMCYYLIEEYKNALIYIGKIKKAALHKLDQDEMVFLDALYFYIELRDISKTHGEALTALKAFYTEAVIFKLDKWFEQDGAHIQKIFYAKVFSDQGVAAIHEQASQLNNIIFKLYEARSKSRIDQENISLLFTG